MADSFFIRVINGKIILWDYKQHAQYEIDLPHFERIVELTAGAKLTNSPIDEVLSTSGIFNNKETNAWGWDCLSRIFHVGTQIGLQEGGEFPDNDGYQGYLNYCASIKDKIPEMHIERPGKIIALPAPDIDKLKKKSLSEVLFNRKTTRAFDGESLDLVDMSTALWATFGAVHGEDRADMEKLGLMPVGYRRTSPSGGSMHPSEPYLVAMRVNGLPPGIYHYRSHTHELSLIREDFDDAQLGAFLCGQNCANDLSYGIFITSRFDKMWWKYPHSRAYRVTLLDIGCLTQTFQLVCESQGIQSWPTGYFVDHEINKLLHLNTDIESVMFFLGAGRGSGPIAREVLSIINAKSKSV